MLSRHMARFLPESNIKHRLEDIEHIERLPIAEAGISDQGIPFVRVQDGLIFYGFSPNKRQRLVYRTLMSRSFRRKVPEEAYNVVWDIWLRYWRGGHIDQQRYYRLKPGDIVIEAGAYIGYYTLKMAQAVGLTGHVIAVEPVEENRSIIRKNIKANDICNVTLLPYAVWNGKGTTTLYLTDRQKNSLLPGLLRGKGRVRKVTVPTTSIDDIVLEMSDRAPNFVIITVNGAEVKALEGMNRTLEKDVHLVIAAKYVVQGEPTYQRVATLLEERGYHVILDHFGFTKNENPKRHAVVYASRQGA
jgi:FkbM family methyltransferase